MTSRCRRPHHLTDVSRESVTRAATAQAIDRPDAADRPVSDRFRAERLLLAEDNLVNALIARRQFERLGLAVIAVTNGQAAVDAVASADFDIVFMDCQMPTMDGLDATRAIRRLACAARRRIPIVALTANAHEEDRQACLDAGMDDFLTKPAALAELGAVLDRWLPNCA